MTSRIQHRRSSVAGNIPSPSDLQVGEIAINFADRYVYTKNGASAVIRLNSNVYVSETSPVDQTVGDTYLDPQTGKLWAYYGLGGGGDAWNEIVPTVDLSNYLTLDGGAMNGHIVVFGTASGNQAIGFNQTETLITNATDDLLPKDGSIPMTGRLTLSADPLNALHAATKQYVDNAVDIATPDLDDYLPKAGGVMTGQITLPGGGTANQAATANELAAALAAHVALPDPHTQYATNTELNTHKATGATEHPAVTTSVNGFMIAADKARLDTVLPANAAEVLAGTDDEKFISPKEFSDFITPILRPRLTANLTLYVRDNGNDSNDGLADTAGGAFLTWQAAVNFVSTIDFNSYIVTIRCTQTGVTFTGGVAVPPMVGQERAEDLVLWGDMTTPSNVTISVTNSYCFKTENGGRFRIQGFKIQTNGGTLDYPAVHSLDNGLIEVRSCQFGAQPAIIGCSHLMASFGGIIHVVGDYSIISASPGTSGIHLNAIYSGVIKFEAVTVTVTGTPTFNRFAGCNFMALIEALKIVTISGSANGQRYNVSGNSAITSGGRANLFPGSTAGFTSAGGIYI